MFLQQFINGLMLGSVYALIGVGYTLIFGVLRMLNLAHAYIFMAAPFIAFYFISLGVSSYLIAMLLGILCAGLLGVLLYYVCFRPIPQSNALGGFVTSLSFGIILQVIIVNTFGTLSISFDAGVVLPDIEFGSAILSGIQIVGLAFSIILMVWLLWLVNHTRFGRNVRAIAENENAAQLLGVSIRSAVIQVFIISSALAGLAGLLVAMRFESISSHMGDAYALKALAVIVVGGLGDVRGALGAGLILGIAEVLLQAYASGFWAEAFIWILLIVVFLIKPDGIFGQSVRRREV